MQLRERSLAFLVEWHRCPLPAAEQTSRLAEQLVRAPGEHVYPSIETWRACLAELRTLGIESGRLYEAAARLL